MKGKKLLALCMSVIMLLSVFSIAAYAENDPALDENTYIASDGTYVHTFNNFEFPDGELSEDLSYEYEPDGIIGEDTRIRIDNTKVFPYKACVYIYCTYDAGNGKLIYVRGSGNIIGKYTVLTAAHILYHNEYGWPKYIAVYPGYDGNILRLPVLCEADKAFIYPGYIGGTEQEQYQNDMAVIRLNVPVGIITGTFGYSAANVSVGDGFTITGYPMDKTDGKPYKSYGTVSEISSSEIFFNNDVYKGESGSGVYDSSYNIVAVTAHAYPKTKENPKRNGGTLITIQKFAWIDEFNHSDEYPVYRLYNQNSGEHFYTMSDTEASQLRDIGWRYEGVAWYSPKSGIPIHRLYNSNGSEHFFTADVNEKNNLVNAGWKYEGVVFYTDDSCTINVYRLYNPNAISNNHFFTASITERDDLIAAGWKYEGVAWKGVSIK